MKPGGGTDILQSPALVATRSIGVSIIAERSCIARLGEKLAPFDDISIRGTAYEQATGLKLLDDPGLSVMLVTSPAFASMAIAHNPDVRILAFLRVPSVREARAMLSVGAHGCCLTSVRPSAFHDAILVVAQGAVWLDREIAEALFQGPRDGGPSAPFESLSPREREVLELLVAGHSNDEIAEAIGRTRPTVRTHLASVYRKLGVNDRVSAAVAALGGKVK